MLSDWQIFCVFNVRDVFLEALVMCATGFPYVYFYHSVCSQLHGLNCMFDSEINSYIKRSVLDPEWRLEEERKGHIFAVDVIAGVGSRRSGVRCVEFGVN